MAPSASPWRACAFSAPARRASGGLRVPQCAVCGGFRTGGEAEWRFASGGLHVPAEKWAASMPAWWRRRRPAIIRSEIGNPCAGQGSLALAASFIQAVMQAIWHLSPEQSGGALRIGRKAGSISVGCAAAARHFGGLRERRYVSRLARKRQSSWCLRLCNARRDRIVERSRTGRL